MSKEAYDWERCKGHEKEMSTIQRKMDENQVLLTSIADSLDFVVNRVAVNGSRGLQNVMRDQHENIRANRIDIKELKVLTHEAKVNRQMSKAWQEWMAVHPIMRKLIGTGRRAFFTATGTILALLIANYFKSILGIFS